MTAPPTVIVERLVMTMLTELGSGVVIPVDLVWSEAAHVEVQLFMQQRNADAVEWVIGRQLLVDGLTRSVGDGDVRIQPSPDGGTVHIVLRTDDGAVFAADDADLRYFLDRTVLLVPVDAPVEVPDPEWFAAGDAS